MTTLDCMAAISFTDNRELFFFMEDQIKAFDTDKCLGIQKGNHMIMTECSEETSF